MEENARLASTESSTQKSLDLKQKKIKKLEKDLDQINDQTF